MKFIQSLLLYCSLAALMGSCAYPYQVYFTESDSVINDPLEGYIFENDTFLIYYDFWAPGGEMLFTVNNKTSQPLFLDMSKSQLVVNGKGYKYYDEDYLPEVAPILGTPDAPLEMQAVISIPPYQGRQIETFAVNYNWNSLRLKDRATYKPSNSPLHFRNELVYATNEYFDQAQSLKNKFWIKKVIKFRNRDFKRISKVDKQKESKFYVYNTAKEEETDVWVNLLGGLIDILFLF